MTTARNVPTPPDTSAALVEVGSPYRATAPLAQAIPIARKRGLGVMDAVLFGLVLAVTALLLFDQAPIAFVVGVGTSMLGLLRFADRAGLRGVHRIDADERGIRLRCTDAALAQALAVKSPRAVDLFIPWAECISVDARPYRFGDDTEVALVITTPSGPIGVRRGAFAVDPKEIARRLDVAREQLALPASD